MNIPMDARRRVSDYLQAHHVMTLATVGDDGPDAAAVFYVNRGLDFYFVSAPQSRHCRNAHLDPQVAVTIHEDYPVWSAIKGVQLHGIVRPLESVEIDPARTLFAAKFPDVPLQQGASGAVAGAILKASWYGLAVTRLRFIDNSRAFGHRDEWPRAAFLAGSDAPP
jgi:uncharacterized protein YhbP (UPF0306 family)